MQIQIPKRDKKIRKRSRKEFTQQKKKDSLARQNWGNTEDVDKMVEEFNTYIHTATFIILSPFLVTSFTKPANLTTIDKYTFNFISD